MIPLTLSEIAHIVHGTVHDASANSVVVDGPVVVDSREVSPGGLFAAFRGVRADGHEFAELAMRSGAAGVLAARPVGVPSVVVSDVQTALGQLASEIVRRLSGVRVIGVTGSSGKTSTKDLLTHERGRIGPTVATQGTLNNEIGLPLTVLRADDATRNLVLEMGAQAKGDIAYLAELAKPSVGVVLNVGSAHLGEFGDRDTIAATKRELVEALGEECLAVLNADDARVATMASWTRARVVSFGEAPGADVRAEDVQVDPQGRARFTMVVRGRSIRLRLSLHGEHHVSNALAAAAVGVELGGGLTQIAAALEEARPLSAARMEVSVRDDGVNIINDAFNANPESMRTALRALAVMGNGRRTWAVLGQMAELGEASCIEHEAVGHLLADLRISRLIAVGDSDAAAMAAKAREHSIVTSTELVPDRSTAWDHLREHLRPGDVVLVKASHSAGLQEMADWLRMGARPPR